MVAGTCQTSKSFTKGIRRSFKLWPNMAARWRGEAAMEGCRSRQKSKETDKQTGIADVQQRRSVSLTANSFKWHGSPFRLHSGTFHQYCAFLALLFPQCAAFTGARMFSFLIFAPVKLFSNIYFFALSNTFPQCGFNKGFLLYCNTSMERTTKYKTYRSHRSSPKLRRLHHAIFSTIKIEGKMTSLFKKCSNSSLLFYIIMIWIWFCSVTWWCSS